MQNRTSQVIFDVSFSAKEPALYFENVIPCYFLNEDEELAKHIYKELVPKEIQFKFRSATSTKESWELSEIILLNMILRLQIPGVERREPDKRSLKKYFEMILVYQGKYFKNRSNLLLPLGADSDLTENNNERDILLQIPSIPLINLEKTSWEQILEFRKDVEATRLFRKFRAFLNNNYTGKSRNFIEDDILTKYEEYLDVLKKWKFDTYISSLEILFSSKVLLASSIGVTLSSLYNQPVASIAAVSTGACMEFGKISVNLLKRAHEYKLLTKNNSLTYISYAKKKLENN